MISAKSSSVVVGISTRNRVDVVRKAILSAIEQSHRPLRVAVIDDASTDDTPALQREFPSVSWERWDKRLGYVRARNKIMLTAPEDYYVSLDDDAWFLEGDEIGIAIDYLDSHPRVAAIAFDIVSPDQPERKSRGLKSQVGLFIGCGHVLRLSVVKALGGYTLFPAYYGSEERDLSLRLIDAGYEIVQLDGIHVWHDKATIARDVRPRHRAAVCNDLTLTVWRFPALVALPSLAWKIISHIKFSARHGLTRPCLEGIWDFTRTCRTAWRDRRPVRWASIARHRSLMRLPVETSGQA